MNADLLLRDDSDTFNPYKTSDGNNVVPLNRIKGGIHATSDCPLVLKSAAEELIPGNGVDITDGTFVTYLKDKLDTPKDSSLIPAPINVRVVAIVNSFGELEYYFIGKDDSLIALLFADPQYKFGWSYLYKLTQQGKVRLNGNILDADNYTFGFTFATQSSNTGVYTGEYTIEIINGDVYVDDTMIASVDLNKLYRMQIRKGDDNVVVNLNNTSTTIPLPESSANSHYFSGDIILDNIKVYAKLLSTDELLVDKDDQPILNGELIHCYYCEEESGFRCLDAVGSIHGDILSDEPVHVLFNNISMDNELVGYEEVTDLPTENLTVFMQDENNNLLINSRSDSLHGKKLYPCLKGSCTLTLPSGSYALVSCDSDEGLSTPTISSNVVTFGGSGRYWNLVINDGTSDITFSLAGHPYGIKSDGTVIKGTASTNDCFDGYTNVNPKERYNLYIKNVKGSSNTIKIPAKGASFTYDLLDGTLSANQSGSIVSDMISLTLNTNASICNVRVDGNLIDLHVKQYTSISDCINVVVPENLSNVGYDVEGAELTTYTGDPNLTIAPYCMVDMNVSDDYEVEYEISLDSLSNATSLGNSTEDYSLVDNILTIESNGTQSYAGLRFLDMLPSNPQISEIYRVSFLAKTSKANLRIEIDIADSPKFDIAEIDTKTEYQYFNSILTMPFSRTSNFIDIIMSDASLVNGDTLYLKDFKFEKLTTVTPSHPSSLQMFNRTNMEFFKPENMLLSDFDPSNPYLFSAVLLMNPEKLRSVMYYWNLFSELLNGYLRSVVGYGLFSNVMVFDGINNRIKLEDIITLSPSIDYSINLRIKPSSLGKMLLGTTFNDQTFLLLQTNGVLLLRTVSDIMYFGEVPIELDKWTTISIDKVGTQITVSNSNTGLSQTLTSILTNNFNLNLIGSRLTNDTVYKGLMDCVEIKTPYITTLYTHAELDGAVRDQNREVKYIEKILNGNFDTDTVWNKQLQWTIDTTNKLAVYDGTAAPSYIGQPQTFTAGEKYKLTFKVQSGDMRLNFTNESGQACFGNAYDTYPAREEPYTIEEEAKNNGTALRIYALTPAGNLDNISFQKVYKPINGQVQNATNLNTFRGVDPTAIPAIPYNSLETYRTKTVEALGDNVTDIKDYEVFINENSVKFNQDGVEAKTGYVGSDEIINGDFSQGTAGWIGIGTTSSDAWQVIDGKLRKNTKLNVSAYHPMTLGTRYLLFVDNLVAGKNLYYHEGTGFIKLGSEAKTYTYIFVAQQEYLYLSYLDAAGGELDNVKLFPIGDTVSEVHSISSDVVLTQSDETKQPKKTIIDGIECLDCRDDGTYKYLKASSYTLDPNQPFTVAMWIYGIPSTLVASRSIWLVGHNYTKQGFTTLYYPQEYICIGLWNSENFKSANKVFEAGKWTFAVWTSDATTITTANWLDSFQLYADGILQEVLGTSTVVPTLISSKFEINGYGNGGGACNNLIFESLIAEQRHWSAEEVLEYYNKTKSKYGIS